jgi:hypothetical protein
VYIEIIIEWIQEASEMLQEEEPIIEIIKKALEFDQYKRPLFK